MLFSVVRRHCIALVILAGFTGASLAQSAGTSLVQYESPVLLVLGDSLSAEYGLRKGNGWVALMEQRLKTQASKVQVVNASISGDTTSGGRSRLPALLAKYRPAIVIIELGGNDALRGLPLSMTQDNLQAMTVAAKNAGAKVLLLGMQVPPNYGPDYNRQFANAFATVARRHQTGLVPFLLKGVADHPDATSLFQADRIHPTEKAHPIVLDNVWPGVRKLLP